MTLKRTRADAAKEVGYAIYTPQKTLPMPLHSLDVQEKNDWDADTDEDDDRWKGPDGAKHIREWHRKKMKAWKESDALSNLFEKTVKCS